MRSQRSLHVCLIRLVLIATAALAWPSIAQQTYFVRTSGNDSASGTSAPTALRTLARAASVAKAGDTVVIGPGTHTGTARFRADGSSTAPITFVGDPTGSRTGDTPGDVILQGTSGTTLRIEADHLRFRDLHVRPGSGHALHLRNARGVRLERCTVSGGNRDAIGLPRTNASLTIVDCTISGGSQDLLQVNQGATVDIVGSVLSGAGGDGIKLDGGTVRLSGTVIRDVSGSGIASPLNKRTVVEADRVEISGTRHGIDFGRGTLTVTGSLIHNVSLSGVHAGNQSPLVDIRNCTIAHTGSHGVYAGKGKLTLINTVIAHTGGHGVERHRQNRQTIDRQHNLYHTTGESAIGDELGGSMASGELVGDPKFAGAGDYAITSGSAAIDAGTDPGSGVVAVDMAGNSRPAGSAWDIGAFETGVVAVAAELPYATGFDQAPGDEWSDDRRRTGRFVGGVHGRFTGKGSGAASTTLTVLTEPGETYEVEFDLILQGSWDPSGRYGDTFYVDVAGRNVLRETFDHRGEARGTWKYRATLTGQDIDGGNGADAQFAGLLATFVATSERTTITFRCETTDPRELFSLDNVEVRAARPESGLVARWTFDETDGLQVLDGSGRGVDLALRGQGIERHADGLFGRTVQGRGQGYGYAGTAGVSDLSLPRGYTFSTWVKSPSTTPPGLFLPIYAANSYLYLEAGNKRLRTYLVDRRRRGRSFTTDISSLDLTTWNHIATRWDPRRGRLTVWLNGELASTHRLSRTNLLGLPSITYTSLSYAFRQGPSVRQDESRIYDRPLSAAEIAELARWPARFADATAGSGFGINASTGPSKPGTAIFGDLNGDGALDAILTGDRSPSRLINDGLGVFSPAPLPARQATQGTGLLDVDQDGDLDLVSVSVDGISTERVFINEGGGGLAGVAASDMAGPNTGRGLVLGNLDGDALCDAVVLSRNGNWLAMHDGDAETGINAEPTRDAIDGFNDGGAAGRGGFVASGDINNDGRIDAVYLINRGRVFLSDDTDSYDAGRFGLSARTPRRGHTGAELADYDNDGDLDLYIAFDRRRASGRLWRNDRGRFVNVTAAAGLPDNLADRSGTFGDVDNDGDLDLFVVSADSRPSRMYFNNGDGTFTLDPNEVSAPIQALDAQFADVDNDGDLDLAVTRSDAPAMLWRNDSQEGEALAVRFVGTGAGKGTNTAGIGVRLELFDDAGTFLMRRDLGVARGLGGQTPLVAHFGGVDPDRAYTLRAHLRSGPVEIPVTPRSAVSSFAGGRSVPQMLTIDESDYISSTRIMQWREVRSPIE